MVFLCGCNNGPLITGGVIYGYEQTYCADPWGAQQSRDQAVAAASAYLTNKGVYVQSLSLDSTALPEGCEACFCRTGYTFFVRTPNTDSMRKPLEEIGFFEIETVEYSD